MNRWRTQLDANLPADLRQIAEWIHRAEEVLARGIPFDPANCTPEENYQRFTELFEEHAVRTLRLEKFTSLSLFLKAIFAEKDLIAAKFQRFQRDPSIVNEQVAPEHLNDLDERLKIVLTTGEERGRYLDFEQIHWKIHIYFQQLINLRTILSKKQGDKHQTEQLYSEYKVKINSVENRPFSLDF